MLKVEPSCETLMATWVTVKVLEQRTEWGLPAVLPLTM
jgi:hypothetical protein